VDFFTRSLVRIASLQGREVLEAVVTGQFEVVSANGGRVMTSASGTDKSFTFQVPSALTTDKIMAAAEYALTFFDSHTETEISYFLTARPKKWARIGFV
jgi:hypothetical protein